MSEQVGRYTSLRTIVAHFLSQYDKSFADEDKCWLLAFRAMMDMHFQVTAEPETFRLPVSANKTVGFPAGVLSWTKIGVLDHDGKINTLKINNALTTWRDGSPNRLSLLTPNVNDTIGSVVNAPFYFNYFYGGNYCNLYGIGTGLIQHGECTVDEANQLVVLSPEFRFDSIMFEAIMSPQMQDDYNVLTILTEPIIAFIEAKLKLNTMDNYYAEVVKARRGIGKHKVTLQGINQVIRESTAMKLPS